MKANSPLLVRIAKAYGIALPRKIEQVALGVLNKNYILSCGDTTYFLRELRDKGAERIDYIIAVETFYKSKGIPVVSPLKTLGGSDTHKEGPMTFVLYPFVEGLHVETKDLEFAHTESFAATLARIHLAGKDAPAELLLHKVKDLDIQTWLSDIKEFIAFIEAKTEKDEFDVRALKALQYKEGVAAALLSEPVLEIPHTHLLHGDYHLKNVFFNPEKEISLVFDWEKSEYGPRALELARSLILVCFDGVFTEERFALARDFMKSYSKVYPISAEELALGFHIRFIQLGCGRWIEKYHYKLKDFRADVFLELDIASLQFLASYKDNFTALASKLLS